MKLAKVSPELLSYLRNSLKAHISTCIMIFQKKKKKNLILAGSFQQHNNILIIKMLIKHFNNKNDYNQKLKLV